MGRKRIVILAGRSFIGTYMASRILCAGEDVAAIVVETRGSTHSVKGKEGHWFEKIFWYLRTGQISELANRVASFFWKPSYEWTHALNRWKEMFRLRIRSLFRRGTPYEEMRKSGTYFFFEDLKHLYQVPVVSAPNLNHPHTIQTIQQYSPDLLVICGTRKLKPEVISVAPGGAINVHGSLLPKYRGLMAEFWALYHNDADSVGVTIHYADSGLDTGDIVLQEKTEVTLRDTFRSLRFKNALLGGRLMVEALKRIEQGTVVRIPQNQKDSSTFHQPSFEDRRKLTRFLSQKRSSSKASFVMLSLIFLLSFFIRIAFAPLGKEKHLMGDEISYDVSATNLVMGRGYVTEGNNTRPPVYPFFLMAHYLLFGHRFSPIWVTQAVLGSLTVLLIGTVAKRYFSGAAVWMVFSLAMVEPALVISSSLLLSECLSVFLLMLSVWLFQQIRERGAVKECLALGASLGFLVLSRGIMIFFPLFLLVGLGVKGGKQQWRRAVLLTAAAFLLTVAPWLLRNQWVYGIPLLNTPQSGEVFYYASHPPQGKHFGVRVEDATVRFARTHFKTDLARERFFFREGLKQMVKVPLATLRLWVLKFLLFWSPFDWELLGEGRYNGVYGFLLPFFVTGMVFLARKIISLWEFFIPVGYALGMALVFYGSPRFRMPIHPFLIFFAVAAIVSLWERFKKQRVPFFLGMGAFLFANLATMSYPENARLMVRDTLRLVGLWS